MNEINPWAVIGAIMLGVFVLSLVRYLIN